MTYICKDTRNVCPPPFCHPWYRAHGISCKGLISANWSTNLTNLLEIKAVREFNSTWLEWCKGCLLQCLCCHVLTFLWFSGWFVSAQSTSRIYAQGLKSRRPIQAIVMAISLLEALFYFVIVDGPLFIRHCVFETLRTEWHFQRHACLSTRHISYKATEELFTPSLYALKRQIVLNAANTKFLFLYYFFRG